ncbi:hypothetical protein [Micromonospora sp. MA102]|uniref:hypothetical protein n=1 Tax=Micromonospora sp. MA102 TaxID=2952755 RepID=UPI0021C71419|nr:hypothetical protein [Micromonospora sp. MA102]
MSIPISSGYVDGQSANTDTKGVARMTVWPTEPMPLRVVPPAGGRLITTTPTIDLSTNVDVLVAYQPNCTVIVLTGSPDAYQTYASRGLDDSAPGG